MESPEGGDGPALAALLGAAEVHGRRRTEEMMEELESIKNRVSLTISEYERNSKPTEDNIKCGNMQFLEDLNQLEEMLKDSVKRNKYKQQVTIFIIGYQNACGERQVILDQLHEFFIRHLSFLSAEEEKLSDIEDNDIEDIAIRVNEALFSAEQATHRLVELNKEMLNYMNTTASSKEGNKKRRKLEKALNKAEAEITNLTVKLAPTQKELEKKERNIKQLIKHSEIKNLQCLQFKSQADDFKSQTEVMKKELESLQQDVEVQKFLLDHQRRQHLSQLEDLRKQLEHALQGKEQLKPHSSQQAEEDPRSSGVLPEVKCIEKDEKKGFPAEMTIEVSELSERGREGGQPKNGDLYSVAAHTGQAKLRPDEETNHSSKEGPREGLLTDSEKDAQLLPRGGFMENKTGGVMLPVNREDAALISTVPFPPGTEKPTLVVTQVSSEQSAVQERLPTEGSEKFLCRRMSALETVQVAFLEHSIDLRDEQALSSIPSDEHYFQAYKTEAVSKIDELEKEVSTLKERFNQTVSCLQDELETKMLHWTQERESLLGQLTEAQTSILYFKKHSLQEHSDQSSQDETEASVHSLTLDESMQSTHAVKSDTGDLSDHTDLDALIDDEAGFMASEPTGTLEGPVEDLLRERSLLCSTSQADGPDALLMEQDLPIVVNKLSRISQHQMNNEFRKLHAQILHFKDAIIKMFLDKEMFIGAQRFYDIAVVQYSPDVDMLDYVCSLASSSQCILNEALTAFSLLLNMNEKEGATSYDGTAHEQRSMSYINSVLEQTSLDSLPVSGLSTADAAMESPTKSELQNQMLQMKTELSIKSQLHQEKDQRSHRLLSDMKQRVDFLQKELNTVKLSTKEEGNRQFNASKKGQDSVILFTRLDIKRNTKVLKKSLSAGRIPQESYEIASQAMGEYSRLQRERFSQLVKQYTQHVTLCEAKKNLSNLRKRAAAAAPDESETLRRIEKLHRRKKETWNRKELDFSERRLNLANMLMSTLINIEEKSGLFLVKPVLSWQGRPATMKGQFKVSTLPKLGTVLHVPLPSFAPTEHTAEPTSESPLLQHMDCFTARFYEGIHHLPSGCDPFPLPMAEGSQGVWEMVMAQPQHVQSSAQITSYNIPKILELDLQRVQFPQQHPCYKLFQKAIPSEVRPIKNTTRSYFTMKHQNYHHCIGYPAHTLPPIQASSEVSFKSHSWKNTLEDCVEQNVHLFSPFKRFCYSAPEINKPI
ncbi:uncharacterized protein LOC117973215 isoform X4 [Acipenser ruthenus]|uniref:uncharacterized protein LOC117973215 isoform X4 n=1 Tax=Acipenser ruthenus TaxID=7906 RepID=UPI0027426C68|nr:uncharacterized protein LOC117973215 isoform X4 [Acipenser ruthenus]